MASPNRLLTFRATPAERERIQAEAARRGTTVGDLVREALVRTGTIPPRNTAPTPAKER